MHEAGPRVVASGFARRRFLIRLRVGHARLDALHNLFFREAGIFQASDLRAPHGWNAFQAAVQNDIHRAIGEPHQPQQHGIAADNVDLIDGCDFQDDWLGVPRLEEVHGGIGAREVMLVLVRVGDQSDARIVADAALLQPDELLNLGVRGVQFFELLDGAGPHARLIEGAIIRERMLVASARTEEDKHAEKHELVPHDSILAGAAGAAARCAVGDTRAKGQVARAAPLVNETRAKEMRDKKTSG